MNKEKVMEIISNEFEKGAACTVVTNKSADSAMRKGSKDNRNPYLGRVEVETVYSGFVMGTDYQRSIENTAKRMGNEAEASALYGRMAAMFDNFPGWSVGVITSKKGFQKDIGHYADKLKSIKAGNLDTTLYIYQSS